MTFHGRKVGHAVGPGRYRCGEIVVADIGLTGGGRTKNGLVTKEILGEVPRRGPLDHKYSAGHVVVVGGSPGLTGAPYLSAEAAMRAGAGYVRAVVPESLAGAFAQRFVEVTLSAAPDEDGLLGTEALEVVLAAAESADASRIGPGLGRSDETRELVRLVLDRVERPLVLDGDGLWAVTGHLEWVFTRDAPTVLTPHAGELGRLLGRESSWVDANRLEAAGGAADDAGAVVLLKGADTLVAAPGPRRARRRPRHTRASRAPAPATCSRASSRRFSPRGWRRSARPRPPSAACGLAARDAAILHGEAGLIARDVIDSLSPVLSRA